MSETVDLDMIEHTFFPKVTLENVKYVLLLDIARSLRVLPGRNPGQAERPDAAAVPSHGAG